MSVRSHRAVLESGLTVVTVEAPALHSVMCAVYVRVGSRHETKATNGVSHLLEHLFFRGSARYPDSVRMNAAVEAVGGNLNAVTMRDSSSYFTPVHVDGVPVALQILGDLLTRPRLVQLETEKRIVLEEMLDEVDERGRDIDVDNLAKRLLYGKHPLALKIAGTPQTVRGLTRAAVRRHFERYYVAGNMVVSVAGPVKRRAVLAEVERAFRRVPRGPRAQEEPPPQARAGGPRTRYVDLEEAQVEFRLCFPSVSEDHPDFLALTLLRRVLDDGLSSRLPYNIVERRGLAYSIGAQVEGFHDAGTFDVDGACAASRLGLVVDEVLRTLGTLRAGRISREELQRAQRRLRLHHDFLLDAPGDLCGWFGGHELWRTPESFEARSRAAEALRVGALTAAARRYLTADTLVAVAVGPRSGRRGFEAALARAARRLG